MMLALGSPALSEHIVRHRNAPPALYLNSVTIPPGAETVMVSGTLAAPIDPAKTDSFDAYGDTRAQTISALGRIRKSLVALGYDMAMW